MRRTPPDYEKKVRTVFLDIEDRKNKCRSCLEMKSISEYYYRSYNSNKQESECRECWTKRSEKNRRRWCD